MSSLLQKFEEKINSSKKSTIKDGKSVFDVMYQTGFLEIDYVNGTMVHVESEDRNFSYHSTGIVDGSTNTVIGRSGSGKSSLTTQIIGYIAKTFIDQGYDIDIHIDDIEGSLPESRKYFLLDIPKEQLEGKLFIRNSGITAENLYEAIQIIRDVKIQNRKEYEYDTGLFDVYGNRIFKLVPTLYLVDSLAMLLPKNIVDDSELGTSMDASSIAKSNTMLFKKISQLCKEANIIFFTINHIMDDIQMGFIPKAAQISGLKQGERLPGGKAAIYLANNMFRLDDSKTLKAEEGYGINGSVVNVTLLKSRTNATKRAVPLIFNKSEGRFDNLLSLLHMLKEEGRLQGAGGHLFLDKCPDIKFSLKSFKEVYNDNPELQQAFARECYDILVTFLSETRQKSLDSNDSARTISNLFLQFANEEGVA